MYGYGYEYGNGPWMHGLFGGGLMTILWIVLIGVGIAFVVQLFRRPGGNVTGNTALNILRERYARGEIGKEEFDLKKREIA